MYSTDIEREFWDIELTSINRSHSCLVVKYPRTDEPGLGKWKEEVNGIFLCATFCQLVLSEGRPYLDRRAWQRLSTTDCAKLAFLNDNLSIPGKVSLEFFFLKFQPMGILS